ncbi:MULTISPECIES: DUF3099 domain-containing protein [unclassified Nocardioides]|uniref:DUF3099 domain-containing protein n=1 Tax=unclassified Nocardioides TaxID=2615069 RepID=UPI00360B2B2B
MAREVHRHGTRHGDEPVRITTAATSREADIAGRQRRYVVSMAIRTACFIGAVAVGPGVLRWVLVAAALLLPYVAVVMANAVTTKDDGFSLPNQQYVRELEERSERDTPN